MYLIETIPIHGGLDKSTLTYFSSRKYAIGSIINAPLRSKNIRALVVSVLIANTSKAELKSRDHKLKKITPQKEIQILSPVFIDACKEMADFSSSTIGKVLYYLLPRQLLNNPWYIKLDAKNRLNVDNNTNSAIYSPYILHTITNERHAIYRSKIREEFAKNKSVLIITPTIYGAKQLHMILSKGIEQYSALSYGSQTKKEFLSSWQNVTNQNHPTMIIGTQSAICLPRSDISVIILENELDRAWKSVAPPHFDLRIFLEILGRKMAIELIIGGTILRPETYYRFKIGQLHELSEPRFRILTSSQSELVNMNESKKNNKKEFKVLSQKLINSINDAGKESERFFLYAQRRGLSPITVCDDCSTTVLCGQCSAPTVLHESRDKEPKRFFLCHKCGEVRDANELCTKCGGWRLSALGIAVEQVGQCVKKMFPSRNIFILESETAKRPKDIEKILTDFSSAKGAILIGTEMALPCLAHLSVPIEHVGIVSLDSLFALPDFRINERIFNIILSLRMLAQHTFYIQTRRPNEQTIDIALRGHALDFYRSELKMRENLFYPPFSTLIKLSMQGQRSVVEDEFKNIGKFLSDYKPAIYPAFTEIIKGKFKMCCLIKLEKSAWPDKTLLNKLQSMPRHIFVEIDPESIL
jgi:primosomal protein N' (replication factor Y) (superfamily II helicase)